MSSVAPKALTIQFFDVGQGDGMYIVFPDDTTMLIDLGSTKNKELTSTDVTTYLTTETKFKNKGQTLDYLILTHGDRDHYNMVLAFLKDQQVVLEHLMYGGYPADYKTGSTNLIKEIFKLHPNLPVIRAVEFPASMGDFGGAQVHVLAQDSQPSSVADDAWRKNTGSVVIRIYYEGIVILLTGDATTETEITVVNNLVAKGLADTLASDVLKIGHHGSRRTSNSAWWLRAVNPQYSIISSDRMGWVRPDGRPSGHRLPQLLTIDLLAAFAPALSQTCAEHSWVAHYQRADYVEFNLNPDQPPGRKIPFKPDDLEDGWIQLSGGAGIFSTLAIMDQSQPDGSLADIGAQYSLVVRDDGSLQILSTLEDSPVAATVAVSPAPPAGDDDDENGGDESEDEEEKLRVKKKFKPDPDEHKGDRS